MTTAADIIDAACTRYRVPRRKLRGPVSRRPLVRARYLIAYLLRHERRLTDAQIARMLCRHPDTVRHGIAQWANLRARHDLDCRAAEQDVRARLGLHHHDAYRPAVAAVPASAEAAIAQ